MKKVNLELVQWLMKKMEMAQNQIEYNKGALKREQESAQADEREIDSIDSYYAEQVHESEKEYDMLEKVFELI